MKAGARSSTAMAAIGQTHGYRGMNGLSLSPESIVGFIGDIFNRRHDAARHRHHAAAAQGVVECFTAVQMIR